MGGEPWFSGDHMIFAQNGVPCLAMTAERLPQLMREVVHTTADKPEFFDPNKLVEVALALNALIRSID